MARREGPRPPSRPAARVRPSNSQAAPPAATTRQSVRQRITGAFHQVHKLFSGAYPPVQSTSKTQRELDPRHQGQEGRATPPTTELTEGHEALNLGQELYPIAETAEGILMRSMAEKVGFREDGARITKLNQCRDRLIAMINHELPPGVDPNALKEDIEKLNQEIQNRKTEQQAEKHLEGEESLIKRSIDAFEQKFRGVYDELITPGQSRLEKIILLDRLGTLLELHEPWMAEMIHNSPRNSELETDARTIGKTRQNLCSTIEQMRKFIGDQGGRYVRGRAIVEYLYQSPEVAGSKAQNYLQEEGQNNATKVESEMRGVEQRIDQYIRKAENHLSTGLDDLTVMQGIIEPAGREETRLPFTAALRPVALPREVKDDKFAKTAIATGIAIALAVAGVYGYRWYRQNEEDKNERITYVATPDDGQTSILDKAQEIMNDVKETAGIIASQLPRPAPTETSEQAAIPQEPPHIAPPPSPAQQPISPAPETITRQQVVEQHEVRPPVTAPTTLTSKTPLEDHKLTPIPVPTPATQPLQIDTIDEEPSGVQWSVANVGGSMILESMTIDGTTYTAEELLRGHGFGIATRDNRTYLILNTKDKRCELTGSVQTFPGDTRLTFSENCEWAEFVRPPLDALEP